MLSARDGVSTFPSRAEFRPQLPLRPVPVHREGRPFHRRAASPRPAVLIHRSPSHRLLFPTAAAASFRLEGSCFTGAGFAGPFSRPEPSPPQAFSVSGELPATSDARFRAAFRSRSSTSPHASHRKTRSPSSISPFTCPHAEHIFVDG